MQFFERWWRRVSGGDAAERAEASGDLVLAIRLWLANGESDEAARVMLLRAEAEPDPKMRLQHLTQAASIATEGSAGQREARVKKAKLTLALAEGLSLSPALRRDVIDAARVLEDAGEASLAATAYRLAGDADSEARTLAQVGDVDELEAVLGREALRSKGATESRQVQAEIDELAASGRRREALLLASAHPGDPVSLSVAARLRGRRVGGPVVRVVLRGQPLALVLGDEVTLGRTAECEISIASSALSRRHLRLARDGGRFVAEDLGTRNGTQLRGLNVGHRLEIGSGVTLTLGGLVRADLAPSSEVNGALAVDVGGERYIVPLGEVTLGDLGWQLGRGKDEWVELRTGAAPAFLERLAMSSPVTLLRGDAFSAERGGPVVLRVDE